MALVSIVVLILCSTAVVFADDLLDAALDPESAESEDSPDVFFDPASNLTEGTEQRDESPDDSEIELIVGVNPEEIDVICSKQTEDPNERAWTWLDATDLNLKGHWREHGICINKYGISRFRFRAFKLEIPDNYGIVNQRCKSHGYHFAQPARVDPLHGPSTFGWPDRDFDGVHGPLGYQFGGGRPDSQWERHSELAHDGWYLFETEPGIFTQGFVSIEPCNRLQVVKDLFALHEIPCNRYRRCVQGPDVDEE